MIDLTAGKALAEALGLDAGSSDDAITQVLSSDELFVKQETQVLETVAWLSLQRGADSPLSVDVWRTIRFAYLTHSALSAIQAAIRTSTTGRAAAATAALSRFPSELAPHVAQQVILRSSRQSDASLGRVRFGTSAFFEDGIIEWGAPPTPASALAARPRRSYCFTVDVHGNSNLGRGSGLFFIWVDPKAPMSCNTVSLQPSPDGDAASAVGGGTSHGLPEKYRKHINEWGAAYGQEPTAFNGAQCLLAVAEASSHPEFGTFASCALQRRRKVLAATEKVINDPATSSEQVESALTTAAESHDSLLDLYRWLASSGGWIHCVDIARLAICWLCGGGSVYLDTDMGVGTHALPKPLVCMKDAPSSSSAAKHMLSPTSTNSPIDAFPLSISGAGGKDASSAAQPAAAIVSTPLLVLAQDADGLIQNNFIGALTPFHPFLTLLLQSIILSAIEEGHVVKATGPAMLTAVHCAFADTRAQPSPSMLLIPPTSTSAGGANGTSVNAVTGGVTSPPPVASPVSPQQSPGQDGWSLARASAAVARIIYDQRRSTSAGVPAMPPIFVPSQGQDADYRAVLVALPAPLPQSSFHYLTQVPRVAALATPPSAGNPSFDAVSEAITSCKPLERLRLGDTVHVCPPSTFYPRHWREGTTSAATAGHEEAAAGAALSAWGQPPASEPSPISADVAEARELRKLASQQHQPSRQYAAALVPYSETPAAEIDDNSAEKVGSDSSGLMSSSPAVWMPDIRAQPEEVAQLSRSLRSAARARRMRAHHASSSRHGGHPLPYGGPGTGTGIGAGLMSALPLRIEIPGASGGTYVGSGIYPGGQVTAGPGGAGTAEGPQTILFGVHSWDCTWGSYTTGGSGSSTGPMTSAQQAYGSAAAESPTSQAYLGYGSARTSVSAGASGAAAGLSPAMQQSPFAAGPSAAAALTGYGGAYVMPGMTGPYNPATMDPTLLAAATGYSAAGSELTSPLPASTAAAATSSIVYVGGGASPLLVADVFGVGQLAGRVIRRMVQAGYLLEPGGGGT